MLGVHGKYAGKRMNSGDGHKYRHRFGELFVTMCQFPRADWKYWKPEEKHVPESVMKDFQHLLPFYEDLETAGIALRLQRFVPAMVDLRNKFDHAWTANSQGVPPSVLDSGRDCLESLNQTIDMLMDHKCL